MRDHMWPWRWYRDLMDRLSRLEIAIALLEYLMTVLLASARRPARPRRVRLLVTQEIDSMLKFKLQLPPVGAADVVKRELEVAVGVAEAVFLTLDGTQTEVEHESFRGADNEEVDVSLTDIDDAGNRSEPRDQTFVLLDTLSPPQPGQLGLVVTSEE